MQRTRAGRVLPAAVLEEVCLLPDVPACRAGRGFPWTSRV